MPAARFCSQCGQRIKLKRVSPLPFDSFCARCAPRFERARLLLLAAPLLCAAIGYAAGHYTSAREPFHFIGTPLALSATPAEFSSRDDVRSSTEGRAAARPDQVLDVPKAADGICGARTRSGKPCQRKVKGGGYCWQHRGKSGEKDSALNRVK